MSASARNDTETFHAKGGCSEFVKFLNAKQEAAAPRGDRIARRNSDDIGIELAMQYNEATPKPCSTFVNNINTHEGGTHLTGFKAALTRRHQRLRSARAGFRKRKRLTSRLSGDDVREGLTAVLS